MQYTNWYREFYDRSILIGYRGSITHGTFRPSKDSSIPDDRDVIAVVMNPIDHYFGFTMQDVWERKEGIWDLVAYEARKYLGLLLKSNPSVLESLWLPSNYYIKMTPAGKLLIEYRNLFMTKEVSKTFLGYAYSQMKKVEAGKTNGAMGAKRKALVEQFGFDTKNVAQAIRLLKMGMEILCTGEMRVEREDNRYLVDIRQGKYSLEYCKAEATNYIKMVEDALIKSVLPVRPDKERVNALLVQVMQLHFSAKT